MRRRPARVGLSVAVAIGLLAPCAAQAALFWGQGVRARDIPVCFAGDAPTSRPARVAQIRAYLQEFSGAANINLTGLAACAPPVKDASGKDDFGTGIRVVIPGTSAPFTGRIPGVGCTAFLDANGVYNGGNDGGGSWSNGPGEALNNRSCLYNLKLNDDAGPSGVPYLNHTLHEFGHALGLGHEHERSDVDTSVCSQPGFGGGATGGFITPYDRFSVMHYNFPACGIDGNYGYGGLSDLDRLALHVMYPEDDHAAEFVGTTVIPRGVALRLGSAWEARGANMSYAASAFSWRLGAAVLGNQPRIDVPGLPVGTHQIQLARGDFLGRTYATSIQVRVLRPRRYAATILAPTASAGVIGAWTP